MMAELQENLQYGLSSSANSASNKTILLLKLTDSSLKTIELYQNIKSSTKQRPSIQFKGSKGTITFPVQSSGGRHENKEFKFTAQSLSAPSGSSFECIQQYRRNHVGAQLESLGCISAKVNVHATEEVYQDTKHKMKMADEEMKKSSTKEVSVKGLKPGRKVKLKDKSTLAKEILAKQKAPSASSSSTAASSSSSMSSSSSSLSSLSSSAMSSSTGKSAITWNNGAKTTSTSKLGSSNSSSSSSSSSSSGPKPSQSARHSVPHKSYRERIIHLLALRPYKKPELLLRLQRDGVSQKDKNQLSSILAQVASLSRDMSYVLNKHLYNEVQEDWSLYSEEDRQILRKHLGNLKKSPAHSVSPSSSPPPPSASNKTREKPPEKFRAIKKSIQRANNSSSNTSQKRQLLPEYKDYKPPKKQRIAHNNKKASPVPNGTPNSANSSPSTKSDIVSTTNPSPVMNPSPDQSSSSANHVSISPSRKSKEHSKASEAHNGGSSSGNSRKGADSTGKHSPAGVVSSTSNVPEFISTYTTIASMEQRQRYKDNFNAEYPTYKKLHEEVASVQKQFADMKEKLRKLPEDSEEYKCISIKVIEEYNKIQADKIYQDKRTKWQELHDKLEHIKSLIVTYDSSR